LLGDFFLTKAVKWNGCLAPGSSRIGCIKKRRSHVVCDFFFFCEASCFLHYNTLKKTVRYFKRIDGCIMKCFSQESMAISNSKAPTAVLWMIFMLGMLSAFGPLSIDMYLPALPNLANDLHCNTSLAQLSLTACLFGLALGQMFAGPISDVHGRRGSLLVGMVLYVVSSLLCVVAPTIWVLIVMRFVQGLAGAAGIVISRAMARDLYSGAELTRFFSMLMLVSGVAPILAPILGGQLLQFTSWRGIFIVLVGVGMFMLVAVFLGLSETLPDTLHSQGGLKNTLLTFQGLIGNRKFMGYALAQGFSSAAMFAYIAGSPFVLQNIFGVSPQMFSLLFAMNSLGIIIASQITGRLTGRIHDTTLLVAGLLIAFVGGAVLLAMILLGGELSSILLPLFFVVSSGGIIGTSCFSLAMQDQARAAGSASALMGLLTFIFGGFMAPLVGIAGSYTAIPMGIVIAFATTASLLCYFFLVKRSS
jgi:DHA1 family bicyclomycin/chloramphenicol resistance-like MFS transporter